LSEAEIYMLNATENACRIIDLMQVADLVRRRAETYITRGGASLPLPLIGLSSSAPTEFLGLYGLAESFLYALRVYDFIISSSASDLVPVVAAKASEARIHRLIETIKVGWQPDPLARFLPLQGLYDLRAAAADARQALGLPSELDEDASKAGGKVEGTCPATGEPRPPVQSLLAHLEVIAPALYTTFNGSSVASRGRPNKFQMLPTVRLRSGAEMPLLGLGTWQLEGQEAEDVVYLALQLGYRALDCAEAYRNEEAVGRAIKRAMDEGIVKREDLFIATKVSSEEHAGAHTANLVRSQLSALSVSYIDLYYLHSPMPQGLQRATWSALERLVEKGLIRDLGVSNFDGNSLEFFNTSSSSSSSSSSLGLTRKIKTQPSVLQNKWDIYHHGKQLDNQGDDVGRLADAHGLVLLAYSPFSSYPFSLLPTADPVVLSIAQRHRPIPITLAAEVVPHTHLQEVFEFSSGAIRITPAMVLVRWALQLGLAQIPRSSSKQRLIENLLAASQVMQPLSADDMKLLSDLHLLTASPLCVAK
jgi:diketogulonate reductase-like aldo/keto reductase